MLLRAFGKIWKLLPREVRAALARTTQAQFTVSAAGIVTNERGEVLLLNHVLRPTSGWGIPGGFIDRNEQPEAALRRELREETGIELSHVELYRVRTMRRHMEIIYTARGIGEASVQSREIIELGWFAIEEMPEEMSLDQQFLIRKALSEPPAVAGG